MAVAGERCAWDLGVLVCESVCGFFLYCWAGSRGLCLYVSSVMMICREGGFL